MPILMVYNNSFQEDRKAELTRFYKEILVGEKTLKIKEDHISVLFVEIKPPMKGNTVFVEIKMIEREKALENVLRKVAQEICEKTKAVIKNVSVECFIECINPKFFCISGN